MSNNGSKQGKVGAVMVVGAGICGMQASLDLANSGYKVYLIDKTSAIGGRMSQLDKTFPTNDCAMCIISPKLIEVGKHLNIDIITDAELQAVEGEEGNFNVEVIQKPRFIDPDKCNACGDCVEVCPVSVPSEFEELLGMRKATYRRYPQAIPGAMLISKDARPPCKLTCPAGCNGQGYVALISQGKYQEALNHIKQWIPLPASLGRICHHPCEEKCNRSEIDAPIGIAPLKRFAADFVRQKIREGVYQPEEKPAIDAAKAKVAVVGAGPSGLACAADLVTLGYPVTVFEAGPKPGGQLQTAIPKYRLPKDILATDIQEIIDLGIDLKTNSPVTVASLKSQGYEAVYLAIGAQKGRGLPIPGGDHPGVLMNLDFLKAANAGSVAKLGKQVVIVGGGNVAMDVARVAIRLGAAKVSCVCLESAKEMPAHSWEIDEAMEEGIKIHNSWGPKEVNTKGDKVTGIVFEKCTSVFDSSGKFSPVFDKSSTLKLDCDTVVMAIGQMTELSALSTETKVKTTPGGWIISDPITLATGEEGVFAGGDGVTGPKSAVEAIQHGHEAAISIDRYIQGKDLSEGRENKEQESAPVPEGKWEKKARVSKEMISLERRRSSFDEVERTYTEEEAKAEAARCMNCGLCSECLQCVAACGANAIDHNMNSKTLNLQVGSIVLTTGIDKFDAELRGEYGFGRMPNVVTSVQFERILSASGPYQGKVLRPSDGNHPVKVAWIQCVGSRDSTCGRDYCSSVCCMYATKEAIIAKEHDNRIEPTIFYNDMRAFGKGFERYYESAKDHFGIKYVKGIPSGVKELQQTKNLRLEYAGEDGQKVEEDFDMVVLSVGMIPTPGTKELAKKLGIEVDRFGFCENPEEFKPNATTRPGIYVAGAFDAPMDIPESVMNSSSAAFLATREITEVRGTMITEKEYPPEREVQEEEPRIGVFVCRCGTNIARVVDVPGVVDYVKDLPNVIVAEENLYTCSTDTQAKMVEAIKENNLNRVIVASCTPRTHEPLFQDTCREAGLNKYLFEMANIRDQCSWVHSLHMPEATDKAKDLVRMAVARAALLEPLHQMPVGIKRKALIIGGGLAGMTAALGFAEQKFESVLVEKTSQLGGNLGLVPYTLEGSKPNELLESVLDRVENEPMITVYKETEVVNFSGFVGNYVTTIQTADGQKQDIEHGVVVVATGGVEYKPEEYLYGQSSAVVTQREFENSLAEGKTNPNNIKSLVMIQCVGSREEGHMYCSRVCCNQAVKNALLVNDANPDAQIFILYRDMRTYGLNELKYREAREKGIMFVRYDADKKPEVTEESGKIRVKVFDSVMGADIVLQPDTLVLSAATRPQPDAHEFASKLKLPLTQDGFFMEAHMKLRPLDFTNDGMYLCGLAHGPKLISETMAQAQGVVSRALTILSQPHLMAGGMVSVINQDDCVACLTCVRSCPFGVPKVNEDGVAEIEAAACQGCGICASACPRKAIQLQHYKDVQVMAKTSVLVA